MTSPTAIEEKAEDLLKVTEAGQYLRMHPDWVARQCKKGVIPSVKFGREWRIRRDALYAFAAGTNGKAVTPAQGGRKKTARQKRRDAT